MAHHDILAKCDRALMQFIINSNAGTAADTFPGKWSQDKPIPCTICFSHSFTTDKELPYSGLYMVESFIEIRSSGVDEQFDTVGSAAGRAISRNEATYDLFFQGDGASGQILGGLITAAAKSPAASMRSSFTVVSTCPNACPPPFPVVP